MSIKSNFRSKFQTSIGLVVNHLPFDRFENKKKSINSEFTMWKKKSLVNRIDLSIVLVPRCDFADKLVNKANKNVNVKTADLLPVFMEN